jgi:hypothetical protein
VTGNVVVCSVFLVPERHHGSSGGSCCPQMFRA